VDIAIIVFGGMTVSDAMRLSMEYRLDERFDDTDPENAAEYVRRITAEDIKPSRALRGVVDR
jgi:hypothetical protein